MILPLRRAQNINSAKAIFRKTTRAKFYYRLYNEGFISICVCNLWCYTVYTPLGCTAYIMYIMYSLQRQHLIYNIILKLNKFQKKF